MSGTLQAHRQMRKHSESISSSFLSFLLTVGQLCGDAAPSVVPPVYRPDVALCWDGFLLTRLGSKG